MGLKAGCKCAMWSLKVDEDGTLIANLSTSKRKKDSKEYETDWKNMFVKLYGKAYENFKDYTLAEGEFMEVRIGWGYDRPNTYGTGTFKQAPFEVKNTYSKEKGEKTYYSIYDAEPIVSDKPKAESTPEISMEIPDTIQESLPFK